MNHATADVLLANPIPATALLAKLSLDSPARESVSRTVPATTSDWTVCARPATLSARAASTDVTTALPVL